MTKTETAKIDVETEIEKFRQLVIASRSDASIGPQSQKCVERLNGLFHKDPKQFTAEDTRWLNVLRGYLGVRLDSHNPKGEYTRQKKRKGDELDHCWRCETPIDERFTEYCITCGSKDYQWRVCPVCRACGCQSSGRILV